jgi:hypothetical protein
VSSTTQSAVYVDALGVVDKKRQDLPHHHGHVDLPPSQVALRHLPTWQRKPS